MSKSGSQCQTSPDVVSDVVDLWRLLTLRNEGGRDSTQTYLARAPVHRLVTGSKVCRQANELLGLFATSTAELEQI
eukprot:1727947-Amphidinium_carterae.1